MSSYYGTVTGSAKTPATRRGTESTGIIAAVQSWKGSIIVELFGDPDNPTASIAFAEGSQHRGGRALFQGPLAELQSATYGPQVASTRNDESLDLARLVVEWARTPGNHGGNPYLHPFVKLASKILGEE